MLTKVLNANIQECRVDECPGIHSRGTAAQVDVFRVQFAEGKIPVIIIVLARRWLSQHVLSQGLIVLRLEYGFDRKGCIPTGFAGSWTELSETL